MTVLAQALALFLRSNFFLTFLRGVFLGPDVPVMPGNSPCFQCLFLTGGGAANAQRTVKVLEREEDLWRMRDKEVEPLPRETEEGRSEEEKEKESEAMAAFNRHSTEVDECVAHF